MRWGKTRNVSRVLLIVALFSVIVVSSTAFSLGIGAAPGTISFGDAYRGKRYTGNSYILTTASSKIIISLRYAEPHVAWELNPGPRTEFNISQASEEDITKWVKFPQNPVLIDPSYKAYIRLPDGSTVAANKKITFYVDIPRNAEPGYHMGSVSIDPQLSSSLGTGVSTIGVSRIVFTFRVPGEVKRELDAIDIEARRVSDRDADFDVLVKNKGTVTTSFRIGELKVFDSQGNILAVLSAGWSKLSPGETGIVTVHWHSNKPIESEYYTAKAKLSWYYGESSVSQNVEIPEKVELKAKPITKCSGFPLWFALLTTIAVMAGVYLAGSVPLVATVGLILLSAYKLVKCGSPEIWPLLLIVLAYLYDRVMR